MSDYPVWASFTEPERVARWYGVIDGTPLPGHTITITMTAEEGAPAEPARIIECDPPRGFLIDTEGMGDPGDCASISKRPTARRP